MKSPRSVPGNFGPFALSERLGSGGHGAAYLATDPERGRLPGTFVVKVLHELESKVLLDRFRHEAEILLYIDSPHVVRVLESGVIEGEPYLAMELAPGWRVSKCLDIISAAGQRPAIAETVEVFAGGLRGLAAIHEARHPRTGAPLEVVHRDITPKNLMVDQKRVMRIIDFGLGRSAQKSFDTKTGMLLGTPGYMAPEVVLGRAVDHRADLYAFAIILWEWLTLQRYIPKGSLTEMLAASKAPRFVAPSTVVGRALPEDIDELLHVALAHDPAARFENARAMLAALEGARGVLVDETEVLPTRIYVPTEYERSPSSPAASISATPVSATPAQTRSVEAERLFWPRAFVLLGLVVVGVGLGWFLRGDRGQRANLAPVVAPSPRAAPGLRVIAEPVPVEPEKEPNSNRVRRPRGRPSRETSPEPRVEAAPEPSEARTVETELAACRQLAAQVSALRPDLEPRISRVLDQVAMDAAIRDRAASLARLEVARRKLERLLEENSGAAVSPDTTDSNR